ncbi:PIG-L family deacetylase [Candidatus Woesearchaeota archaeon]|nr:PIG-L family deacetylase [Candidatus Woesearchaeota archaeon]
MEKRDSEEKKNILVVCAHSDDQVIGPGGAMAKFAREGYNVYTIIFSYGELSHPHVKRSYIAKIRVQESREADKIIGGSGVFFLGIKDGIMKEDFLKKKMRSKLLNIFLKYDPEMIFTHSRDDLLPDHRFVREVVLGIYDELSRKKKLVSDVYSFDVWNIWNLLKRNNPFLIVDVSKTFKYKVRALKEFKSQINFFSHTFLVNVLFVSVFVKAYLNGLRYKFKRVEVFYKLR